MLEIFLVIFKREIEINLEHFLLLFGGGGKHHFTNAQTAKKTLQKRLSFMPVCGHSM